MNEKVNQINRLYVRTDGNGTVTHIFSEVFEAPILGDVCIDEQNLNRHGANRYVLHDEYGIPNYRIADGTLIERNKEKDLQKNSFTRQIETLKSNLSATDYKALKYADGALREEDYAETKAERQTWREEINRLQQKLQEV